MKFKTKRIIFVWIISIVLPIVIISFFSIYLTITRLDEEIHQFYHTISVWYDLIATLIPFFGLAVFATIRIMKFDGLQPKIGERKYILFDFGITIIILSVYVFIIWNNLYFNGDLQYRLWGRSFAIFLIPIFGLIIVIFAFHARLFLQFIRSLYTNKN